MSKTMSLRNINALLVLRNVHASKSPVAKLIFVKSDRALARFFGCQKFSFSTSSARTSIFKNNTNDRVDTDLPDYGQPLESWYYDVHKFGKLVVRSPISVHVQPLDVMKHPDMNKLFVNILYTGKDELQNQELSTLAKQYIVNVDLDDRNEEIDVTIKNKSDIPVPLQCHVQIPLKYDVRVSCRNEGGASLEHLEGENINVKTQKGSCYFKGIKSNDVTIKTAGGNIESRGLLQGNLKLATEGNGVIDADRLQGQTVACHGDRGSISVKAIYAESSEFISFSGDVHLGSCHGNSKVKIERGNLSVDTLDGDMAGEIQSGDASIYIAREGNLDMVCEEGNVSIKVPSTLESDLYLVGSEIEEGEVTVHDKQETQEANLKKLTGRLGTGSSSKGRIGARTSDGRIKLHPFDWLSSLNLKGETT